MRKIYLVIPIAAVVISLLVTYKLTRPPQPPIEIPNPAVLRIAPPLSLYDQRSRLVRINPAYIGRHKLLVIFYDGSHGPHGSELLQRAIRGFAAIHESRPVVLAVSAVQSAANRRALEAEGPVPFILLSDILDYQAHRQWGVFDERTNTPREAVFVIDRTGWIRHVHLGPDKLGTVEEWAAELKAVR